ncbi:MAG TPA: sigma-54 dependent transcriptional regulator [Methylomirabilota bacterium]|jgi:DNA-binding NtrC family response regulator|nr:sigma-54 dependent transcriptional regulator [Methylomirabilota bacterium]
MKSTLLIVDDERSIRVGLKGLLTKEGYEVNVAENGEEALKLLEGQAFALVLTDLRMPGIDGLSLLKKIKEKHPDTAVMMMTAYGSEKIAVEAMKAGAHDYIVKPFDNDEVKILVRQALEQSALRREVRQLRERLDTAFRFENILGASPAMQRVCDVVRKVAPTDLTVLITGESGTGKELIANALHQNSPRKNGPFIKVNCAAMVRELVESELFGHEKGAFTGAVAAREGKFAAADGGTLFLDEIGDMPLETQAKVLRVLQEREFERVGGNRMIKVDVRVIAATNKNLPQMVRDNAFREDLFYRLNVVPIMLPPLRERQDDIRLLATHFVQEAADRYGRESLTLSADAYSLLLSAPWPGNVRELKNVIEAATVLTAGPEIRAIDLRLGQQSQISETQPSLSFREAKQQLIDAFERDFIARALRRHRGNITKAAEEMGMHRQQLQQKIRELELRGYEGEKEI